MALYYSQLNIIAMSFQASTGYQGMIIISVEELSTIVEDASQKGALKALKEMELHKAEAKLLAKEYLTIKETCLLLKKSRPTINRWIKDNKLTKYYVNGSPRLKTSEVMKLRSNKN